MQTIKFSLLPLTIALLSSGCSHLEKAPQSSMLTSTQPKTTIEQTVEISTLLAGAQSMSAETDTRVAMSSSHQDKDIYYDQMKAQQAHQYAKARSESEGYSKMKADKTKQYALAIARANAMSTSRKLGTKGGRPPVFIYTQPNPAKYAKIIENEVRLTKQDAVSTLALDTDTGSYSNVRRFLREGALPPADAVRVEELINYFHYDDASSNGKDPFSITTEVSSLPWNRKHLLLRVGVKAVDIKAKDMPPANLVFLVDVSGSMDSEDKLPLLKAGLKLLVKQLRPQDRVSIISYANTEKLVLPSTQGDHKAAMMGAIDSLEAAGSTQGEHALRMAYHEARKHWQKNGINRILMATDGDFNVGVTDTYQMKEMVSRERETGVTLSMLGFGRENLNDEMMEQIADVGNGNYGYIDSLQEAQRIFSDELTSTFNTVAQDVKIQLEFNPQQIAEWRLIGYENRVLREADFKNDKVDAGDVGAGKTVTALYELTPVGETGLYDPSRYSKSINENPTVENKSELGFLKVRYKQPMGTQSVLITRTIDGTARERKHSAVLPSDDFRFSAAVAAFGQLLRQSKFMGDYHFSDVIQLAQNAKGSDKHGTRSEFIELVKLTDSLHPVKPVNP